MKRRGDTMIPEGRPPKSAKVTFSLKRKRGDGDISGDDGEGSGNDDEQDSNVPLHC